jgi:hypothetical protein
MSGLECAAVVAAVTVRSGDQEIKRSESMTVSEAGNQTIKHAVSPMVEQRVR